MRWSGRAGVFHRQRVIGAAFDRGVVGYDHALDPFDTTNAGDHARGGYVFAVDLMGGQLADLEEGRAWVEQAIDALAWQQFASRSMPPGPWGRRLG